MVNDNITFEDWENDDQIDDSGPLEIPEEYRHLNAETIQLSLREIWASYLKGEIVVQPDFQRNYVWDVQRASRYIESLLLGLPTPAVFVANDSDGKWSVIDGHQRLETIFRFMQPFLQGPTQKQGKEFSGYANVVPLRLNHLQVLSELNNRDAVALSDLDRSILWDRKLTIIRIPREADPRMKYELFARLNQGSMSLNSQEIRNCLYRGPYNSVISDLGANGKFLALHGKKAPDKRMKHQELVLRFFALLHRYDRYRPPLRTFLNEEMEEHRYAGSSLLNEFRQEFEAALVWNERVFGKEVFRLFRTGSTGRPLGRWTPRRYDLVYEVSMVGFAQFREQLNDAWINLSSDKQGHFANELRHALVEVMADAQWAITLNHNTTHPSMLNHRFDTWLSKLEATSDDPSLAVERAKHRRERLVESPDCLVCQQQLTRDDATRSLTSSGSLVHYFCKETEVSQLT